MLSDAELAYAAGFFDGEGHIAIVFKGENPHAKGKSKYARYRLRCSVSQTSAPVLHWMKERFGGTVRFARGKRSYNQTLYSRWNWDISTREARDFLRAIRPWLIVKADEADIALRFAETMDAKTGRGALDPKVVEFRARCHEEIRGVRQRRSAGCLL